MICIKNHPADRGKLVRITRELATRCTDMVRKGEDFPTVWSAVLRHHGLVHGAPVSKLNNGRPVIEIRLITGERLVFDGEARTFCLKRAASCAASEFANGRDTASDNVASSRLGAKDMWKIQIRSLKRLTACLLCAMVAASVLAPLASQAAEQAADAAQTAIRAALSKWTDDFNAGNAQAACALFSRDLRYDYRGFPERNYTDMCDGLRRSLTDRTKQYSYALDIREILVSDDQAVVRLIWTLTVTKAGAKPEVSLEHGIDVFQKQRARTWKIIRFIAYD